MRPSTLSTAFAALERPDSVGGKFGINGLAVLITLLFMLAALGTIVIGAATETPQILVFLPLFLLLGVLTPFTLRMADQWERAVVLRLGKLRNIHGPGLFITIPFIDAVATWLDNRIQTTEFNAQQALSKDTVPVNIDAVVFWQIHDPERAALEITDYRRAIQQVAETSLREMVGSSMLSTLLAERKKGDAMLREVIGRKTADWGVAVISVEIRDIGVPQALQDAMSAQAQAERQRLARVLLGQAEQEVAQKFVEAADIYARSPTALQVRAMNIIYETTKDRGTTILLPTSMVDAMNPAAMIGIAATGVGGAK